MRGMSRRPGADRAAALRALRRAGRVAGRALPGVRGAEDRVRNGTCGGRLRRGRPPLRPQLEGARPAAARSRGRGARRGTLSHVPVSTRSPSSRPTAPAASRVATTPPSGSRANLRCSGSSRASRCSNACAAARQRGATAAERRSVRGAFRADSDGAAPRSPRRRRLHDRSDRVRRVHDTSRGRRAARRGRDLRARSPPHLDFRAEESDRGRLSMELHVKGKNLEVDDSIRSYAERKLEQTRASRARLDTGRARARSGEEPVDRRLAGRRGDRPPEGPRTLASARGRDRHEGRDRRARRQARPPGRRPPRQARAAAASTWTTSSSPSRRRRSRRPSGTLPQEGDVQRADAPRGRARSRRLQHAAGADRRRSAAGRHRGHQARCLGARAAGLGYRDERRGARHAGRSRRLHDTPER